MPAAARPAFGAWVASSEAAHAAHSSQGTRSRGTTSAMTTCHGCSGSGRSNGWRRTEARYAVEPKKTAIMVMSATIRNTRRAAESG
jgi:hypothetical protein